MKVLLTLLLLGFFGFVLTMDTWVKLDWIRRGTWPERKASSMAVDCMFNGIVLAWIIAVLTTWAVQGR